MTVPGNRRGQEFRYSFRGTVDADGRMRVPLNVELVLLRKLAEENSAKMEEYGQPEPEESLFAMALLQTESVE